MTKINLGTTPVQLDADRSRLLIRNLGPGTVYLETDGDVDEDNGFPISVNAVYEFPVSGGGMSIWIMADEADTDVRVIDMG